MKLIRVDENGIQHQYLLPSLKKDIDGIDEKKSSSKQERIKKMLEASGKKIEEDLVFINRIEPNFIYASIKNRSTLSLKDLAGILKNLGCKNAYRIDGGGSTTLWFKPAKATSWTKLQGTGSRSGMWSIAYWTEL